MHTPKKKGQWAGWLLAAATLLLALLLIVNCVSIYRAGTLSGNLTDTGAHINPIYTRELVTRRLGSLWWAFALWLTALAAALRQGTTPGKAVYSTEMRYTLVCSRVNPTEAMEKERRKRKNAALVCAVLCAVCVVLSGVYLLDIRNFTSRDLEAVMGTMVLNVAPFVITAFAARIALTLYANKSMLRELKEASSAEKVKPAPVKEKKYYVSLLRIALYAAAAALTISGVRNGGMKDVFVKAINICTECIGLG